MRHLFLLTLTFILSSSAHGQSIRFIPILDNQIIQQDSFFFFTPYQSPLKITRFAFYISDIILIQKDRERVSAGKKHQLIDLAKPKSLIIQLPNNGVIDSIQFVLGIDSSIQCNGAMGQDLDPVNGMYWTWQSGYIHLKLEGESPAFISRQNKFQFHIGGYVSPWSTIHHLSFSLPEGKENKIFVSLNALFQSIIPAKEFAVMQPGERAAELSTLFSKCFYTEKR